MGDVIDDIISAESDAEELVEEAKRAASQKRAAGDAESARIISEAREEAARLVKEEVARAKEEAAAASGEAVAEAERAGRSYTNEHREVLDRLVDAIVEYVVTPEYGRE